MLFVWTGVALLLMKWAAFGPVANLSWPWVLSPFAAALIWFEVVQPLLGMDRTKGDDRAERAKKARIAQAFEQPRKSR